MFKGVKLPVLGVWWGISQPASQKASQPSQLLLTLSTAITTNHVTATMSGEGPESIPTSADARSHRPTKKRALTPSSSQAKSVDALFAKPDREIAIPPTAIEAAAARRHAPPEIVTNVQGSSAGAGSGEFHVYKASRRREYERLRAMDDEVRREKDQDEFEKEKAERDAKDDEKTRKNREKREKMKARKAKKGKGGGGGPAPTTTNGNAKPANGTADRITKNKEEETEPSSTQDNAPKDAKPAAEQGIIFHDEDD